MTESHVVSGLVTKRSELAGLIDYHQNKIKQIKLDQSAIDTAIKVFNPEYDLRSIKGKQHRIKNNFFAHGEASRILMDIMREADSVITKAEIFDEVVRIKGFVIEGIDRNALKACIFSALKRLQNNGVVREDSRDEGQINWALV